MYYARFDVDDIYHKLMDLGEFAAVAFTSMHIAGLHGHDADSVKHNALAFTGGLCLHNILCLLRWSEVMWGHGDTNPGKIARDAVTSSLVTMFLDLFTVWQAWHGVPVHTLLGFAAANFLIYHTLRFAGWLVRDRSMFRARGRGGRAVPAT